MRVTKAKDNLKIKYFSLRLFNNDKNSFIFRDFKAPEDYIIRNLQPISKQTEEQREPDHTGESSSSLVDFAELEN